MADPPSKKTNTVNKTISPFYNIIISFVNLLIFPVIFILYFFAFYYLRFSLTFPIAMLLLLILHIGIAGVFGTKMMNHDVNYDDFLLNIFDIDLKNHNTRQFYLFFQIFKIIIYIGPFASWVLLLASLGLVIDVLNRLGFYNDKSDIFNYLNDAYRNLLHYIIIFFIISILFIFILYGITSSQVIRKDSSFKENINFNWITYTPIRLLSTTILLLSFITYYILSGFNSNLFLGFGIGLSILFYLMNIIFNTIDLTSFYTSWRFAIIGFLGLNMMFLIIAIPFIYVFYYSIFYESYTILIPLVTWLLITIYNCIIINILYANKPNNTINIQYIVSLIIVILMISSSVTLYNSLVFNNNIRIITNG